MKSVILLHGALGTKEQMQPLADILIKEARVYLYDLSGHGIKSSDENELSMEFLANELDEYIDKNKINDPVIFGYSMGGYVALIHALKYPGKIKKIITLATKFDWTPETAEREAKQLDIETMKTKIPDFVNILQKRHGTNWEKTVSKTADLMVSLGNMKPLNEKTLAQINTQALLCIGDRDKMVSVSETEETAAYLPNGLFKILTDTPHPFERVDFKKLVEIIEQN
jgi:pimeloyl-ACP methyl ester carboxylesterase